MGKRMYSWEKECIHKNINCFVKVSEVRKICCTAAWGDILRSIKKEIIGHDK
jgi:hypothetical protein